MPSASMATGGGEVGLVGRAGWGGVVVGGVGGVGWWWGGAPKKLDRPRKPKLLPSQWGRANTWNKAQQEVGQAGGKE
jgi:hypothetical protein